MCVKISDNRGVIRLMKIYTKTSLDNVKTAKFYDLRVYLDLST